MMRDVYPISIIPRLKEVPELISICCSLANPIEVIIIETKQGRALLGVVDGFKQKR
jgi:adenosine/AMP kinase